jgi:hypothetical protein
LPRGPEGREEGLAILPRAELIGSNQRKQSRNQETKFHKLVVFCWTMEANRLGRDLSWLIHRRSGLKRKRKAWVGWLFYRVGIYVQDLTELKKDQDANIVPMILYSYSYPSSPLIIKKFNFFYSRYLALLLHHLIRSRPSVRCCLPIHPP